MHGPTSVGASGYKNTIRRHPFFALYFVSIVYSASQRGKKKKVELDAYCFLALVCMLGSWSAVLCCVNTVIWRGINCFWGNRGRDWLAELPLHKCQMRLRPHSLYTTDGVLAYYRRRHKYIKSGIIEEWFKCDAQASVTNPIRCTNESVIIVVAFKLIPCIFAPKLGAYKVAPSNHLGKAGLAPGTIFLQKFRSK